MDEVGEEGRERVLEADRGADRRGTPEDRQGGLGRDEPVAAERRQLAHRDAVARDDERLAAGLQSKITPEARVTRSECEIAAGNRVDTFDPVLQSCKTGIRPGIRMLDRCLRNALKRLKNCAKVTNKVTNKNA